MGKKSGTHSNDFNMWKNKILSKILARLNTLFSTDKYRYSKPILNLPNVIAYIKKIHDQFVIVPVNKAGNNFAIVCKYFYISRLKQELGIDDGHIKGNEVYKYVHFSTTDIVNDHKNFLSSYGITLNKDNQDVPVLYWTAKLHKTPYKARFIAGSVHSTLKQPAKELAIVLKSYSIPT